MPQINSVLPIEKILEEYQTKSLRSVAKQYNVNKTTIRRILIKNNIPIRQKPLSLHMPRITNRYSRIAKKSKEIINDYLEGIGSWRLCKKYNCSSAGVLRVLKINGITRRKDPLIKHIDMTQLKELYSNQKKSITEISKIIKTHHATITKYLKQNGVRPSEQQVIDMDNGIRVDLNKIKEGIEKDPRFFYCLGAFKGDGHYNIKQKKVQISVIDLDFLEEIKYVFNELSPETKMNILEHKQPTKTTKKQWRMNICSREFFNKRFHKLLPQTLEEKRFYLQGLFDAEGSVSRDGLSITITQKDTNDLKMWQKWLTELGITTSMGLRNGAVKEYKHYNGKTYTSKADGGQLRVYGNDSKINFYDAIGFKIKRKQERLYQGIKKINPLPVYQISNELVSHDFNKMKLLKVKSITFHKKEQGVDLSIIDSEHHNFVSDNGILEKNSTHALQIAFFIAWLLAGGKMVPTDKLNARGYPYWTIGKSPAKKINFGLDNIVFSPTELMKKAHTLYETYGKNQVIVYDEGRAGLDSARAMEQVNKAMQDFFQECGFMGHVILVVLPNFFKLHEDYAVSRSVFLVDVYTNAKLERGFFSFYNERQKEFLYFLGKKRIGASLKYGGTNPSFKGRFTQFLPIDKDEYEAAKSQALKEKRKLGPQQTKLLIQRNGVIVALYKYSKLSPSKVAKLINASCMYGINEHSIVAVINNYNKNKIKSENMRGDDTFEESDIESIQSDEKDKDEE